MKNKNSMQSTRSLRKLEDEKKKNNEKWYLSIQSHYFKTSYPFHNLFFFFV